MHMHIIIPKQTAFMVLYPFLESLVGVVCFPWLTVYACEPILSTLVCIKIAHFGILHISYHFNRLITCKIPRIML